MYLTLADDSWQRAHYALVIAAGALSLGRDVVLFAGGRSVHALAKDWSALNDITSDIELSERGIAGFDDLRRALQELGCRFFACEAGMKMAKLTPDNLIDGVEIRGIVSFLELVGQEKIVAI